MSNKLIQNPLPQAKQKTFTHILAHLSKSKNTKHTSYQVITNQTLNV